METAPVIAPGFALTLSADRARIGQPPAARILLILPLFPAHPMSIESLTHQPKIPAWIVSMVAHASLLLLLVLWVQRPPQGAAEEPTREVGIVLKRATAEGVKFEGESDHLADQTANVDSSHATPNDPVATLPDLASHSNAAEALPELPGLGPLAGGGSEANAANMTEGGGITGGAHGDIGEKSRVRVFGAEGVGTKFVYLFDRSASMEGAPLSAAKGQLIESLGSLKEIHQFQIIFFNTRAPVFTLAGSRRIAFATDTSKRRAEQQVQSVTADGGTDRLEALKRALSLTPDVIFFLTDADDSMSRPDLEEVYRRNRRAGAMICTIEFGRGPARSRQNFLTELAHKTGGAYVYVNTDAL